MNLIPHDVIAFDFFPAKKTDSENSGNFICQNIIEKVVWMFCD